MLFKHSCLEALALMSKNNYLMLVRVKLSKAPSWNGLRWVFLTHCFWIGIFMTAKIIYSVVKLSAISKSNLKCCQERMT